MRPHRRGSIVWPVCLILAGVIFLLQNFGIVSGQIWGSIWRLWPLVLILIGLEIVLGGAGRGLFGAVLVAFLVVAVGAIIGTGMFGSSVSPAGPVRSHTTSQSLQDATSADVSLQIGAGSLEVGSLDGQPGQLAQMTYDGPDQLTPRASYRVRSGVGELMYRVHGGPPFRLPFAGNGSGSGQINLLLNSDIPLSLHIQEGASDSRIDLSQLRVSNLELQTGASSTTLVLPQSAGATSASIKGGASTIEVQIPHGVAAQIQYEGGLSTLNVDQSRFPSTGARSYRSADYDAATNKVDLTIQAGVATVSIR